MWDKLPKHVREPNPEIYLEYPYTVLDFEITGGSDKGHWRNRSNGVLLACWKFVEAPESGGIPKAKSTVYWGSEFELSSLHRDVARSKFVVAHNAKFEAGWLDRCGVGTRTTLFYCTLLGDYCIAGNRKMALDLDSCCARYGIRGKSGLVSTLIKGGIDPKDIPRDLLEDYCVNDVEVTHELFKRQLPVIVESDLLRVVYCRNLVVPVLADIETRGMQLDEARVKNRSRQLQPEYDRASESIRTHTNGINFRSPKQLASYLYDELKFKELQDRKGDPVRSKAGGRSTSKTTISRLHCETSAQRAFKAVLEEVAKLKKPIQILEQMLGCCGEDNGIIFASINQAVTGTHRFSSTGGKWGLQFHNFPRAFKNLFRARKAGWVICEGDAPQLEFRVAGDLGHDRRALEDVLSGVDVHSLSSEILRVGRQEAKAHTFKPLYGGQSGTQREREYYEAFRERYPNIYSTQQGWTYNVLRDGYLITASGLRFYWPDTKITGSGWITNTPSIFNYPIQMFATADIIPLTLVLIWCMLEGKESFLINTIHDSVIAEVLESELEEIRAIYRWAFTDGVVRMLKALYNYEFTIPLGVGIKVGINWSEGEEEKYEGLRRSSDGKARQEREDPVFFQA